MLRNRLLFSPLCALVGLALLLPAFADDWPHWRGPQRNDHIGEDSGWRDGRWELGRPAWEKNVGIGSSSPIVIDGRLYALGWNDGRDTLRCLDAKTGTELWAVSYPCPKYGRLSTGDEGLYAGPCSTPEFDPQTGWLYTLSIDGDLRCCDSRQKGRAVWDLNLYDQYRVRRRPKVGRSGLRDYGYTSSPLVHQDWVIVEVGSERGTLIGFDKRTGAERWTSQYTGPAGHTGGPTPMSVDGVPCVAVLAHHDLLVARLDGQNAGRTVATYPWLTEFANNIASPTVDGQHVLVTSGYNQNALCKLHITLQGARKLWEQPTHSKVCSPVVHKGHVYWSWRSVFCLDYETGRQKWSSPPRLGDAGSCIVTADDRLIVWADRGTLLLVETAGRSPKQYRELARLDRLFNTDVWPHVVLADRHLYCKDRQGNLKCFAVSAAERE